VALKTLEVRFSTNVSTLQAEMAAAAASVREFNTVATSGAGGAVPTFQQATQEAGKLATAHRDLAAAAGQSATAHRQAESAIGSLAGRLTSLMTPMSALTSGGKEAANQISELGKAGASLESSFAGGPELAVAALGAAVATLGVVMAKDGVESFLTLAGNARQLQQVIGGTAEDASVLSHVGQKLGIDVDTMGVAFGRLARTIGDNPAKLEAYGIAIARNKNGTVDMTATLENVADAYQKTVDPTTRAVMAQDLFSRGWVQLAPILAQGRQGLEDIRKEAAQHHEIFHQSDEDAARNFQFAIHNLQASVESLDRSMASGMVSELTDLANGFASVAQHADDLAGHVGGLGNIFNSVVGSLPGIGQLVEGLQLLGHSASEASKAQIEQQDALSGLGQEELDVSAASGDLAASTAGLTLEQKQAATAAQEQKQAEQALADAVALTGGSMEGISGALIDAAANAHAFAIGVQDAQQSANVMYDAITKATDPLTVASNSIQAQVQAQQDAATASKAATKATNDQATAQADAVRSSNEMQSALHGEETANRSLATARQQYQDLLDFGLADEAARTELNQARALEQETTATRSLAEAQKSLNDLLAFGLDEERQRAALDAQSSALDHAQALEDQASAQKKLADIEAGRVGMADSARPQAIADAQMALARANIQVQQTSLDAGDAQRKLNDLQNGGQQDEIAAAEDKVTQAYLGQQDAALGENEALRALNQLRATNGTQARELADAEARITDALDAQQQAYGRVQQAQLSQGKAGAAASKAAADQITGATNTISEDQARAHYTFAQWMADEQTSVDKTRDWQDKITQLAIHGHLATATELAKMGPEWAGLVDDALRQTDPQLAKMDQLFGTRGAMAGAAAAFEMQESLKALAGIADHEGYQAAHDLAQKLEAGATTVGQIWDQYQKDITGAANAVLGAIGGTLIPAPVAQAEQSQFNGVYPALGPPPPAPNVAAPTGGLGGLINIGGQAFGGIDEAHITNREQYRVVRYGEPETGWEAYIPGAPDRRDRAVSITQEVARRFGYDLVPTSEGLGFHQMAEGGIVDLPAVPQLGPGTINVVTGDVMTYTRNVVQSLLQARVDEARTRAAMIGVAAGGPAPPGQLADWINEAIAITGVPTSWAHGLYIIAMGETGGNPTEVNDWDSNARAGNPSEGLMQTTISTFQGNALPGHGDIFNPIDNLIAAIRYIEGRYGDISNVPGVRSVDAGGPYKPYAFGGIVDELGRPVPVSVMDSGVGVLDPGWNMVGNFTGAPEPIHGGPGGGDHIVNINVPAGLVQVVQHNAGGNDPALLAKATKEVVEPAVERAMFELRTAIQVVR